MKKKYKILAGAFVGLAVCSISAIFYIYQLFSTPNILVEKENRTLFIPPNATFKQVVDSLDKYEMINDRVSFMFVAKLLGYQEKTPKEGRYILKKNMSNLVAIRKLRAGSQDAVKVTFNNVRLKKDLAGKIVRNLSLDSLEILKMLNSPAIATKYGFDTTTIMCMFLPNTYEMYWNTTPDKLFDRMSLEYKNYWTQERKDKASKINFTPLQVSILASIVEAETKKKDEAKTVAGLYVNRLNQNEPLQADPTVVFAIGDFAKKRILFKDLEFESPYNTYRHTGLPPGPINLPTLNSLEAVLNYEKHKYIFMCAKEDFSGYHAFAETYEDHLKNAERYRNALDRAGIR
jgi:UPF0755 protein